jgi:phenylalanyl-tRNA synthetase beta chain
MRVTLRWLQHFADIPDDPAAVARALESLGHEIDSSETLAVPFSGVVVGRVEEIRAHPSADKVRLCTVAIGDERREIVCGAWNFEEGAVVPVALPGAVLAGGFEIGRRKIRGVVSDGMICSETELGLGEDAAGIMVLDAAGDPGSDFGEGLPYPDTVYDLEITPNRPDCMSVAGVARDLAAFFEVPFREPAIEIAPQPAPGDVRIRIDDAAGCPRYVARVVEGVQSGPSPLWMRLRLEAAGVRPINNIVDATNYVLMAFGHPTHVFDRSRLGNEIVVRRAREGETMRTLDGVDRTLHAEDLVIADSERPVAIAGVMGGEDTEVHEATTDVIIESAYFHPPSVMMTSKRHGLRSEASARFERGMDPAFAPVAADLVADLLVRYAGGTLAGDAVDAHPAAIEPRRIDFQCSEISRVLGIDLEPDHAADLLRRLGFGVTGDDPLRVVVPTRRPDVSRPVDLIEEIARLHGYDRIPETIVTGPGGGLPAELSRLRILRRTLVGAGFHEAMLFSFIGEEDLEAMRFESGDPRGNWIRVTNPLREEEGVLRPTLLPGLLRAAGLNRARHAPGSALFEIGKVFVRGGESIPTQPDHVAFVAAGNRPGSWDDPGATGYDVFDATGVWELIAHAFRFPAAVEAARIAGFHPERAARALAGDEEAGVVGEIDPDVAAAFGLEGRVIAGEFDLGVVLTERKQWQFRSPSSFPPVIFDLAFETAVGTGAAALATAIHDAAGPMLERLELFDVFSGAPLPSGMRSLAYRLTFRAPDRTLTDEELAPVRASIIDTVGQRTGARLRGAE